MTDLRRRDFLRASAVAGGGLLVAACAPHAVAPPGAARGCAADCRRRAASAPAATAAPASLTGTVGYWHTFTSQSEMAGLDKVTKAFDGEVPERHRQERKRPQRRLHGQVHAGRPGWRQARDDDGLERPPARHGRRWAV